MCRTLSPGLCNALGSILQKQNRVTIINLPKIIMVGLERLSAGKCVLLLCGSPAPTQWLEAIRNHPGALIPSSGLHGHESRWCLHTCKQSIHTHKIHWAWQPTPLVSARRRQRQEDLHGFSESQASKGLHSEPCLKNKTKTDKSKKRGFFCFVF